MSNKLRAYLFRAKSKRLAGKMSSINGSFACFFRKYLHNPHKHRSHIWMWLKLVVRLGRRRPSKCVLFAISYSIHWYRIETLNCDSLTPDRPWPHKKGEHTSRSVGWKYLSVHIKIECVSLANDRPSVLLSPHTLSANETAIAPHMLNYSHACDTKSEFKKKTYTGKPASSPKIASRLECGQRAPENIAKYWQMRRPVWICKIYRGQSSSYANDIRTANTFRLYRRAIIPSDFGRTLIKLVDRDPLWRPTPGPRLLSARTEIRRISALGNFILVVVLFQLWCMAMCIAYLLLNSDQ